MTLKENGEAEDRELLERYRRASDADTAVPSDAVRAAILAESRRVAGELAKKDPQRVFDESRPAANDSRWKIPAFGTLGAALLAALLIAPRYWQTAPESKLSTAQNYAPAPAAAPVPAPATSAAPKAESPARPAVSDALQDVVVTGARRRTAEAQTPIAAMSAPLPAKDLPLDNPAPPTAAASSAAPSVAPLEESSRTAVSARFADSAGNDSGILPGHPSAPIPARLQSAAKAGDLSQANALLDRGAVVDTRDAKGRTPLMLAIAQGRLDVVRLLLQRGANPNIADNSGKTALQLATDQNLTDIAALLRDAGAR